MLMKYLKNDNKIGNKMMLCLRSNESVGIKEENNIAQIYISSANKSTPLPWLLAKDLTIYHIVFIGLTITLTFHKCSCNLYI